MKYKASNELVITPYVYIRTLDDEYLHRCIYQAILKQVYFPTDFKHEYIVTQVTTKNQFNFK